MSKQRKRVIANGNDDANSHETTGLDMLQFTALHSEHINRSQAEQPVQETTDSDTARYRLKIQPQPPRYPFVSQYFGIKIFLVDHKDTMKVDSRIPIEVTLIYNNGEKVPDQSILEIEGGPDIIISTQGMASARFRIRDVSMKHENRRFCLKFACKMDSSGYMNQIVSPIISGEMTVIQHKLEIQPTPSFPKTWYKDEGGRDKFIEIQAKLLNQNNETVIDREVPLRVVLTYDGDSENEVKNQSILKMSNDSSAKIDSRTGTALLKVRIEEVSKNHQKQAFCVKIAPDTSFSPANYDIAMDVSPAIVVKSKRNKRNRKDAFRGMDKKAKMDMSSHIAASSLLNMSGPALDSSAFNAEQIANVQNKGDFSLVLHMTRSWCQYVMQGFEQMEWQHVGFEVMEGGQLNLHRPLYRCPGCWAYKDTLREPRHREDCVIAKATQTFKRCSIDESLSKMVNALSASSKGKSTVGTNRMIIDKSARENVSRSGVLEKETSVAEKRASKSDLQQSNLNGSKDAELKWGDAKARSQGQENPTSTLAAAAALARASIGDKKTVSLPPDFKRPKKASKNSIEPAKAPEPPVPTILPMPTSGLPPSLLPVPASSRNLSLGFLKSPLDEVFSTGPLDTLTDENKVQAILVVQSPNGFPAFDKDEKLAGFYVYDEANMVVTFYKISQYNLSSEQIHEIEELLRLHKNGKGEKGLVVTKEQEITLQKMKEQVMMSIFQLIEDAQGFTLPTESFGI